MYSKKELDPLHLFVSNVTNIFSIFLDVYDGIWALAILCELLQEMIAAKHWPAAEMVVRELHQVAEVDFPDEPMDQSAFQMFCDLLTDCIIETDELN